MTELWQLAARGKRFRNRQIVGMVEVAVKAVVPLHLLQVGEGGEVVDVLGCERLINELATCGLRPGCRLELLRQGNPLLCKIGETRLSLRAEGQVEILIAIG